MKKRAFIRIHLTSAVLILLFFLSIPAFVSYVYSVYVFKPQQEKKMRDLDNVQARIIDDLRVLSKKPAFAKPQYTKNAYELLKDKVAWYGAYSGDVSLLVENYQRFLGAVDFRKNSPLKASKSDLDDFYKAYILRMGSMDGLAWLPKLYDFNHWSYADQKIYSDILWNVSQMSGIKRMDVASKLPVPAFVDLRDYAILYFLQKNEEQNPLEGLRLIRHVAQLIQTSGALVSQMSAVQLLEMEHHLVELYGVSDWETIDMVSLEAYKRVSMAWPGVYELVNTKEKWQAFQPYMDPEHGICSVVHEWPMGSFGLSDFLQPRWPFEMNILPLQREKTLEMVHLQAECDAEPYSAFLEPTADEGWYVTSQNSIAGRNPAEKYSGPKLNRAKIPYVRQIYGMILLNIATPNAFRSYEKTEN